MDRHPNAIAVLARVILELATNHYIDERKVATVRENDKLSNKIEKTANYIAERGEIDNKYRSEIYKLAHADVIISANTMHRYVHSPTFSPAPKHLLPIWDTLARYVVNCLNT